MIKSITTILFIFLGPIVLLTGCNNTKKEDNNNEVRKTIRLNDTMVISENDTNILNMHFICNGTHFEAIKIQADNILIQNSLFENCDTGISIHQANNVIIKGNRFENIGAGIIFNGKATKVSVSYNEFQKIGERDCTRATGGRDCNIIGVRELSSNVNLSYNLIDNRNSHAIFMEDYISIYTGKQNKSSNVKIDKNLLIGSSLKNASSYSGGCIVLDGKSANNTISNNQCYNVSGYGIVAASANHSTIINNRVYITKKHHDSIKKDRRGNSHVFAFGATSFHSKTCASFINFTKNEGYAYHDDYAHHVKVAWMPCLNAGDKNSYPDGTYANHIKLLNNDFKSTNPHWKIPKNIFLNLGKNYYSGHH